MQDNTNQQNTGIVYIHKKPASFLSRLLQFFMWLANFKNRIKKRFSKGKFKTEPAPFSKSFTNKLNVSTLQVLGRNVYTITPKAKASKIVIFYVHGGAYISNLVSQHWNLMKNIAEKTRATFIIPDYPLAPTATYLEAYAVVEKAYEEVISKTPTENIIFMGDSAGGGLVFGFAQKLKKENRPQPKQIILLSPWLDITMTNPNIPVMEKQDKMLSKDGLIMAGKSYAGNLPINNYLVSPIYGDYKGLGEISIFIGTNDLFISDSRKLKKLMNEQNISFNYYEYPKMFHVFMAVTMLREAQDSIERISKLIENN